MTGPEHYKEAERLLDAAQRPEPGTLYDARQQGILAQMAQAHATLALTAATMDAVKIDGAQRFAHEWNEATG